MSRHKLLRLFTCLAISLAPISGLSIGFAQDQSAPKIDFTRITGSEDGDLNSPRDSGSLSVQRDASALGTIALFVKAVNGSNWSGVQAKGFFTSGGGSAASPATLAIKDSESFRLDVDGADGQWSTRIHGIYGITTLNNEKKYSLPSTTASTGLFAYPQLFKRVANPLISVIDRGSFTVEGRLLMRITIETPPAVADVEPLSSDRPSVIDFYFDPASHLLVKSAASIQIDSADREKYLQVTTYSQYQSVDGILVPFVYSQTLNGQRQWSLRLTEARLDPAIDTSLFY